MSTLKIFLYWTRYHKFFNIIIMISSIMLVAWETMSERNPSMCHDLFTVIREVSDLSDVHDDNKPKCSSSYVKY